VDDSSQNEAAQGVLDGLCGSESLTANQAQGLFTELVAGRLSESQITAILVAVKGESADELIGAARALRAADRDFPRPDYLFADSCGTGGDGSGSINLSTAAALVAAAAGLPVAKHGNRSMTSRCGSADVLERLGAQLEIPAEQSRRALDETGFCFLYAPYYHPGLRHAGPARRALKVRTIMNLLGPCLNPAEPPVQLLGVADPDLLQPVAATLAALGVERALVVHGAGFDEVALHAETQAVRLCGGEFEQLLLTPEHAGLERRPADALKGGGPDENAQRLKALLIGQGSEVENEVTALNAGALLMTAGIAAGLLEGTRLALDTLRSGAPWRRLAQYVEASHG